MWEVAQSLRNIADRDRGSRLFLASFLPDLLILVRTSTRPAFVLVQVQYKFSSSVSSLCGGVRPATSRLEEPAKNISNELPNVHIIISLETKKKMVRCGCDRCILSRDMLEFESERVDGTNHIVFYRRCIERAEPDRWIVGLFGDQPKRCGVAVSPCFVFCSYDLLPLVHCFTTNDTAAVLSPNLQSNHHNIKYD